jgi:hypothetical protein
MLNQPTQNIISYPPSGGFRIFYSCALIFNILFLRNEPNFLNCKMIVSHFLLIPYASGVRPERVKTNPIQTQSRRSLGFQPENKISYPPIGGFRLPSGFSRKPQTQFSRKTPYTRAHRFRPQNPDSPLRRQKIACFDPKNREKIEPKKGTKHPHDRSALTGQKCGFHDPSPQNRLF